MITLAMQAYWGLSVLNDIQIRSELTILLYDVQGLTFFRTHAVYCHCTIVCFKFAAVSITTAGSVRLKWQFKHVIVVYSTSSRSISCLGFFSFLKNLSRQPSSKRFLLNLSPSVRTTEKQEMEFTRTFCLLQRKILFISDQAKCHSTACYRLG